MIKTLIAKDITGFFDSAKSKGFVVTEIGFVGDNHYHLKKDGWASFDAIGVDGLGTEIRIETQNPKAGQELPNFLEVLQKYLDGTGFAPVDDGSEMSEHLIECHENGYEIVKVGEGDYFIKAPNLLAMHRAWQDPESHDLKIEILNQLV